MKNETRILCLLLSVSFVIGCHSADLKNDDNASSLTRHINTKEEAMSAMFDIAKDVYGMVLQTNASKCVTWCEHGRILDLTGMRKVESLNTMVVRSVFFPKGAENRPLCWRGDDWFDSLPSVVKLGDNPNDEEYAVAANKLVLFIDPSCPDMSVRFNVSGVLYQFRGTGIRQDTTEARCSASLLVASDGHLVTSSLVTTPVR